MTSSGFLRRRVLHICGVSGVWGGRVHFGALGAPMVCAYPISPWLRGALSHSANYYVVCPGNTPGNHPPTEAVRNPFRTASGGVQDSGPWDPWLPAVEHGRRFAQRAHSAGTAHRAPPQLRNV